MYCRSFSEQMSLFMTKALGFGAFCDIFIVQQNLAIVLQRTLNFT